MHDHFDIGHYDCWSNEGKLIAISPKQKKRNLNGFFVQKPIYFTAKPLFDAAMGCFGLYADRWISSINHLHWCDVHY